MNRMDFETLSEAVDFFTENGYEEDFEAEDDKIIGNFSRKEYQPLDLLIIDYYRFEGATDPDDEVAVFAIKAKDGSKGTLVMTYGAEQNQNAELLRKIPRRD
ncbi:phosphoribosylpyrophosphate synthetase [Luteirhabdus pelagi]|uniref:phosphoribosylpyrophosphate synthetase n=1 Tax=Luteirhabdus pelagi TaxID=2792783 RepID=UPI00193A4116|nr:phosphoribosylpyrophosphate synthetase [Luteirhabdus pelagi]